MSSMLPAWEKKTYLVTGGAGFVGSHLVDALIDRGDTVLVIDDLSTGRWESIRHLADHPNFEFVYGSITDTKIMDRLSEQAEVVVHLAASVGVKQILAHPITSIENNVMGTESVLKSALRYGSKVLIASTSEVYGKGSKFPLSEEDDVVLGASSKSRWSYAATKLVDEFLGLAYCMEHGLPVVLFRLFNTVGPRQTGHYGMVIPRFVGQALKNEPITIYGSGEQSRCFCDVSDVVRGLVGLADHPDAPGGIYNLGTTEEVTISEVAEKVKALAGSLSKITYIPYSDAYEYPGFEDINRRVPDTRRIRALLGWEPKHTLDSILERVISFSREQQEQAS